MTNEQRARFGEEAVEVGTPDRGQNDDRTDAIDTVANILHWLASLGEDDPVGILSSASSHFLVESDERVVE